MSEPSTPQAVLALSELGLMVLGSDGGPVVLLSPVEPGFSNPTQSRIISNPVQVEVESNPK